MNIDYQQVTLAVILGLIAWWCLLHIVRTVTYAAGEGWHAARVDQLIRLERLTNGENIN